LQLFAAIAALAHHLEQIKLYFTSDQKHVGTKMLKDFELKRFSRRRKDARPFINSLFRRDLQVTRLSG
jgi:hypothetical protein